MLGQAIQRKKILYYKEMHNQMLDFTNNMENISNINYEILSHTCCEGQID